MNRFNNWMSYSFNDIPLSHKNNREDTLKIHFHLPNGTKNLNYQDALIYNASVMKDNHTEPFDVLLSGGIDSEVVVRTFHTLGIKHNTFIFKYEDDLNIRDINSSIQICNALNLKLQIIDFNLNEFYQSGEAEEIFNKTLVPNVTSLTRIKWLEYLDNVPVFGEGEPYWKRDFGSDYSQKSNWSFHLSETELFISLNSHYINRPVIGEWYQYTPEIMSSYFREPLVNSLLDDQVVGKESTLSSRLRLHRQYWPDIADKSKLTGYEGPTGKPGENPPKCFVNFYNEYKMNELANAKFKYSLEEMNLIFKKETQ